MSARTLFIAAICFFSANLASARLVTMTDYKQMSEQADLIVIATPTANADLPGSTTLPNIVSVGTDGKQRQIPATRVETVFRPVAILKGKLPDNAASFKLLHLKFADPADARSRSAAQLINFDPNGRVQYLMFLKLGADGSYEPFNGQTDPIYSIEPLSQLHTADN